MKQVKDEVIKMEHRTNKTFYFFIYETKQLFQLIILKQNRLQSLLII